MFPLTSCIRANVSTVKRRYRQHRELQTVLSLIHPLSEYCHTVQFIMDMLKCICAHLEVNYPSKMDTVLTVSCKETAGGRQSSYSNQART